MGLNNWVSLNRLRKAVKKVRFILQFNMNRWRLSMLHSTSRGRISFNDGGRISFNDRPGLRSFVEDIEGNELIRSPQGQLQRATSYPSEEDIDNRAEMFIANFHRQLQLERQISLDLQYCRGLSMESTRSD